MSLAVRRFFSTFDASTALEKTSIKNIPQNEQNAYWALLGAPADFQPSADDQHALYQIWLEEQQRRRQSNKIVIHLAGGGLQRVYLASGLQLEVIMLDSDRLVEENEVGDEQMQDFVWRATELLQPVSHDRVRQLTPKDPIA